MKRTNENLAEWMLLMYLLNMMNEYEKKPRYRNVKKHHIDGIEVHRDLITPYRDTLTKYLDVCELIENTEALEVIGFDSINYTFDLIDNIVRDKVDI